MTQMGEQAYNKVVDNFIHFLFPRAIITTGYDTGRITNLGGDGIGTADIMSFKVFCCGTSLCHLYTSKRPISPIATDANGK